MDGSRYNRRQFLILAGAAGLAVIHWQQSAHRQATSTYSQTVLAKNPVGYWRLGDLQTDTIVDLTTYERHGRLHGTPTLGESGALHCDPDQAIKFNGETSYAEIPNHADFSQMTSGQGLTVEVWVRPDLLEFPGEQDGYIHWLGKGESGKHEWGLRFYRKNSLRPNRISAYSWNPTGGLGAGAYFQDELVAGEWLHIVSTYDPGDKTDPLVGVSIYKNGVLRMSPATAAAARYKTYDIVPAHGTAPLRFGTRDLATFLAGALDEIAIYPRVLSAAEILDHYQAATAICSPTPTPTATHTQSTPTLTPSVTPSATPRADYRLALPLIRR